MKDWSSLTLAELQRFVAELEAELGRLKDAIAAANHLLSNTVCTSRAGLATPVEVIRSHLVEHIVGGNWHCVRCGTTVTSLDKFRDWVCAGEGLSGQAPCRD